MSSASPRSKKPKRKRSNLKPATNLLPSTMRLSAKASSTGRRTRSPSKDPATSRGNLLGPNRVLLFATQGDPMPLPHDALVLVADGRKMLFFRNHGDENQIDLRTESHDARRYQRKDREIKSDAPGT